MRKLFTFCFVLLAAWGVTAQDVSVPGFEANPSIEKYTPDARLRTISSVSDVQRATTCGQDTLLYPLFKRNTGAGSSLGAYNTTSANNTISFRAMWYPADDSVTIHGISSYVFLSAAAPTTQDVAVTVWEAGADSFPSALIYNEVFSVDEQNLDYAILTLPKT